MKLELTPEERAERIKANEAEKLERTKDWASGKFGIPRETILGYNSGAAYDKIWVTTEEAANKVAAAVQGKACNGGYFHGMSLGGVTKYPDGQYEVMC